MTVKIVCVVNDKADEESGLITEHGQSFWIQTEHGITLFDTGQTPETLSHNLDKLGLPIRDIDRLVLSHAHYDHTGGLEAVLTANADLPIHAHPDIFRPRYSLRQGKYHSIGLAYDRDALERHGRLTLSADPTEVLPGLWTTGGVNRRPEPPGSSPHLFIRDEAGWQPDPYNDDMSMVLQTGKGLVVICGCCHAGLLNTLFHVQEHFAGPVITVIGGLHLLHADEPYLAHVIDVFEERFPGVALYLNHCTGDNAVARLQSALGGRVRSFPAGSVISGEQWGKE